MLQSPEYSFYLVLQHRQPSASASGSGSASNYFSLSSLILPFSVKVGPTDYHYHCHYRIVSCSTRQPITGYNRTRTRHPLRRHLQSGRSIVTSDALWWILPIRYDETRDKFSSWIVETNQSVATARSFDSAN